MSGRACIAVLAWLAVGGLAPLHAGTALVLSQTAVSLTAVDTDTDTIRGNLALAKGAASLTTSVDGSLAYVAHSDLSQISVIDLASWQVKTTYRAPGEPFGLAASASGKLYVGDWNSADVHELDAATGKLLRSTKAGKSPAHLALTPDGQLLVAAAREANTVTVIDTSDFAARATLPVERSPFALAVAHSGTRALVANAQAGSVSDIDLIKLTVTGTTRVGAMPYGVAFSTDDARAFITNQQSGSVSVLNSDASERPPNFKVGSYPEGIAVAGNTKIYVTNWFSDDLSVVDLETGKELRRIKMPAGPRAVAIVPGSYGR